MKKWTVLMALLCQYLAADLSRQEVLVAHTKKSIALADQGISQLDAFALSVQGMSSDKVRHLLNNLCTLEDAAYLEVGLYRGATLIAAAYQNQERLRDIIAIDEWTEYAEAKESYFNNMWMHLKNPVRTLRRDCFAVDLSKTFASPVNIYFYDGNHSAKAQREAFTYFNPILDDVFIAVVDDWTWPSVRQGTLEAFEQLQYNILYKEELISPQDGGAAWWNGLLVAVIEKTY